MTDKTTNEIWNNAAAVMVKVGKVPFPITDTLIEFIQLRITEEQAKFILAFVKPNLSIDEIKQNTGLAEEEILIKLDTLMDSGIVSGNPDESTGKMTYTLMALFPGIIEYSLMKGESGEREQKVARVFRQIEAEFHEAVQIPLKRNTMLGFWMNLRKSIQSGVVYGKYLKLWSKHNYRIGGKSKYRLEVYL